MIRIAYNKIYMTRGDTARFTISLEEYQQAYELTDKDQIYFIVTEDRRVIDIEDLSTPGSCIFYKEGKEVIISPEDTKELECKNYYYHVRVILAESGDLNTIIEPEILCITPENEEDEDEY